MIKTGQFLKNGGLMIVMMSMIFPANGRSLKPDIEITGEWKVDWTLTYEAMTQDEKNRFNALSEEMKTKISGSFSTRIYNFSSDGSLTVQWTGLKGASAESGSWSSENNILTIVINNTPKAYLVSISNDVLTMTMNREYAQAAVTNLIMTKN